MRYAVLGISGSPRKGGNTEFLIKESLGLIAREKHQTDTFFLSRKKVGFCLACGKCDQKDMCAVQDDFQELYQKAARADALIVGSPVYMRNVTGQLKALFDRFHCTFFEQPLRGKIGGAIAVGGASDSQGIVLNVIHNFLLSSGVYCVPAGVNGLSVVAREKGEVLGQPKSLEGARKLAGNVLKALYAMKQGK